MAAENRAARRANREDGQPFRFTADILDHFLLLEYRLLRSRVLADTNKLLQMIPEADLFRTSLTLLVNQAGKLISDLTHSSQL